MILLTYEIRPGDAKLVYVLTCPKYLSGNIRRNSGLLLSFPWKPLNSSEMGTSRGQRN